MSLDYCGAYWLWNKTKWENATLLLKLTLAKAQKKGFNSVYAGSYSGNYGFWKVMEKWGFNFEKIIIEESSGLPVKIYKYSFKENN